MTYVLSLIFALAAIALGFLITDLCYCALWGNYVEKGQGFPGRPQKLAWSALSFTAGALCGPLFAIFAAVIVGSIYGIPRLLLYDVSTHITLMDPFILGGIGIMATVQLALLVWSYPRMRWFLVLDQA